eukprot:1054303-Prorocentrum_minimum.AAC.2
MASHTKNSPGILFFGLRNPFGIPKLLPPCTLCEPLRGHDPSPAKSPQEQFILATEGCKTLFMKTLIISEVGCRPPHPEMA